jgi:hypothetical protein
MQQEQQMTMRPREIFFKGLVVPGTNGQQLIIRQGYKGGGVGSDRKASDDMDIDT